MAMTADPLTESTVNNLLLEDDAFDFDDDFLADNQPTTILQETRDDKVTLSPRAALKRKADDGELGLDEEVKIKKKRQPVAKLDEARLLSEPGIPKLRTLIRTKQVSKKLRLKGKGHEFSDAARLLNHFQLWLDNLYPRAKFADALQLVEKAGHSKRMHIMRKEWIDEGKPGYQPRSIRNDEDDDVQVVNEPDLFGENQNPSAQVSAAEKTSSNANGNARSLFGNGFIDNEDNQDTLFIPDANKPSEFESERRSDDNNDDPDDDELEALLAAENEERANTTTSTTTNTTRPAPRIAEESEGEDDDDDLDALLAMQDARTKMKAPVTSPSMAVQLSNSTSTATAETVSHSHHENENGIVDDNNEGEGENENEDDDDLDVLLAEHDAQPQRSAQVTINTTIDTAGNPSGDDSANRDEDRQVDDGHSQDSNEDGQGGEDEDFDFLSD